MVSTSRSKQRILLAFALFVSALMVLTACSASTTNLSVSSQEPSGPPNSKSEEASTESSSSPAIPPASSSSVSRRTIDVGNSQDYYDLNVFLSNFTEVWWNVSDFDVKTASAERLAAFAVSHCAMNSREDWEFAENADQRYDIPGKGGGAEGRYNVRVSAKRVSKVVKHFFGVDIDYSDISDDYRGPYHYVDGYVYFGTTNGYGTPDGVALTENVSEETDGSLSVDFAIYRNMLGGYDPADRRYYSMNSKQLAKEFGIDGPTAYGIAKLSVGWGKDEAPAFTLLSYSEQPTTDGVVFEEDDSSIEDEGEGVLDSYENEYLSLELPNAWSGDWDVSESEEHRSAMNASNYSYTFSVGGAEKFTVSCKVFNYRGGETTIGETSGGRAVEFYAAESLTVEEEQFVRQHIQLK